MAKKVIVIGSGFGGLAAALRLRAKGLDITLVEKQPDLGGRARGKRDYGWMLPQLLETNVDQLVFEYANREMKEIELWKEYNIEKELGAGVIDVKSWYVETPSDVADRINQLLKYTDLNKLYVNPDCGFFQLPRWISYKKIERLKCLYFFYIKKR